jgi:DNA-binding NarL/FixJ family response regulator
MDLYMPGVDGLAALERLLSHDKNARVVMLTAAEDKKDILKAVAAGARGYILKPPTREAVLKKVKAALE